MLRTADPRRLIRRILLGTLPLAGWACLPGFGGPERVDPASACIVTSGASGHVGAVSLALTDPVDLDGIVRPRNRSERMLARHLHGTLIDVDCTGRALPGLAASWERDDAGRTWTLLLRDDARFWDGVPVTAADVVQGWRTTGAVADGPTVTALSERRLRVELDGSSPDVPIFLADSRFAVVRRGADNQLIGAGPYRPAHPTAADIVDLVPVDATSPGEASLRFRIAPDVDGRRLLDDGVDMLLTTDPLVWEYATGRAGFRVRPLEWDRTYLLMSPLRGESAAPVSVARVPPGAVAGRFRSELARDAVRADARAAVPPHWWEDLGACRVASAPPAPDAELRPGVPRVVFPRADRTSKDLAERLVALLSNAQIGTDTEATLSLVVPELLAAESQVIAVGLSERDFEDALRRGNEFAYVVTVARRPLAACWEARSLAERAPWLVTGASPGAPADPHRAFANALVPLVDTRPYLILRAEAPAPVTVEWDVVPRVGRMR